LGFRLLLFPYNKQAIEKGIYKVLNKALRLIRIFHDLTQKDLANKLQISKSYLSELESGKKNPTLEIITKYSEQFDIPLSSIMFFSESMDSGDNAEKLRGFVSKKVIAILDFIAEKADSSYAE
jgi:transcriptional regulator with XRE-family HTH domain